jgi:hypothetical protein
MSDGVTEETSAASSSDLDQLAKTAEQQADTTNGGPTGPTTQRGKQKSRQNAIKHGIFAVGILRKRESEAEFLKTVEDMDETFQPVGGLEEILVEKLAMLVWRYRRLLQAEAAEVEHQAESCEDEYMQRKRTYMINAKTAEGLIASASTYTNEVALRAAVASLRELHRQTSEQGLDWERDRKALREVYGPLEEAGSTEPSAVKLKAYPGMEGFVPLNTLARRYRELAGTGKDPQSATDVPPDAAKSIVEMLMVDITRFESMLQEWRERGDDRNQPEVMRRLVPLQDRLQRYEASLDRSFDRTLSQLERLQRLRLGQPVLPAVKVDVSHSP